jgi:hypothetical protein
MRVLGIDIASLTNRVLPAQHARATARNPGIFFGV